jgi:negative regulator of sigma E activity
MSEPIREQLSALLDGELPLEEEGLLFRQLDKHPQHGKVVGRYSLISELIRDSRTPSVSLEISERVRLTLADEASPDLAAPAGWSMSRKGLMGAGIAATVAILGLVSFNLVNQDGLPDAEPIALAQVGSGPGRHSTHAVATTMAVTPARLTGYLMSHGEFSNGPSRQILQSHTVGHMSDKFGWQRAGLITNE